LANRRTGAMCDSNHVVTDPDFLGRPRCTEAYYDESGASFSYSSRTSSAARQSRTKASTNASRAERHASHTAASPTSRRRHRSTGSAHLSRQRRIGKVPNVDYCAELRVPQLR
jgi:hypothetical protein